MRRPHLMAIDSSSSRDQSSGRGPGSPLVIEVWRGSQLTQREEYSEPSVTVGSGQSAMLRVTSPSVSELHAVVNIEDDGTFLVLDLGGLGGIMVNGERVQNASLVAGDAFDIGDLKFRVQPTAADEATEGRSMEYQPSPASLDFA